MDMSLIVPNGQGSISTNSNDDRQIEPIPRLRPRLATNQPMKIREKKKNTVLVSKRVPIKPEPCKHVEVNQIVLFRMRGFCEWPSRILSIDKNVVEVQFFGDRTTQKSVLGENIFKFEESTELILFNLRNRKKKDYEKAIKEAEMMMRIPEEMSILNRV